MEKNIITYFISSVNRTSDSSGAYNCFIELGPLGENYDNFYCKCISLNMNVNTLQANHPVTYILVADDLAENGYKTYGGTNNLSNNQIPLGWINTDNTNAIMQSGEGSQFKVKNLRQKRKIRFRFCDEQLVFEGEHEDPVTAGLFNYTYFDADTEWNCVLLLQPID